MASPAKVDEFLDLVKKSGVADDKRLDAHIQKLRQSKALPSDPAKLAGQLIADGLLTHFQAEQILQGKWRRFVLGKYKILEPIGSGGMGSVYLCEHKLMRRRVAVKVLPPAKAKDESALARFYREARAVAALDHPNIVHAYDIDQDGDLHFLIMEYVDGSSLQEIIKKTGPMEVLRACHYMRQSAMGLEQAHQKSLVHRDIKPGNILVDRTGVVKILDMGLARFFNDEEDILTRKYDENVLGTADYLAPEQIDDSHTVDIRADIYSLGATFYFVLTGKTLFGEGTVGQKLLWHQNRQPKPVSEVRPEVPQALSAMIMKMLSKAPEDRYQGPLEIAEALVPFTQDPVGPPPENEMPRLSLAATGIQPAELGGTTVTKSTGNAVVPPAPVKAHKGVGSSNHQAPGANPAVKPKTPAPSGAAARTSAAVAPPPSSPSAPAEPAEEAEWDKIAADTADTNAQADTDRDGKKKNRPGPVGSRAAQAKEKQRLKGVVLVVGLAFLVPLIVGLAIFFRPRPGPTVDVRQPLQVTEKASGPRQFKTIHQALRAASKGDVIELLDDHYEENVLVDPGRGNVSDVTLQAAADKHVVWKSKMKDEKTPLLRLTNASGFKLLGKGITMDGTLDAKRRLDTLITITFVCPGLTIEDVHLKGFGKNAVTVMNAWGERGRPIRFANLTSTTAADEKPSAVLYFGADPSVPSLPYNDYVEIGPGHRFQGLEASRAIDAKNTVMGKNVSGLPAQN